jgi:hypothetical protein
MVQLHMEQLWHFTMVCLQAVWTGGVSEIAAQQGQNGLCCMSRWRRQAVGDQCMKHRIDGGGGGV